MVGTGFWLYHIKEETKTPKNTNDLTDDEGGSSSSYGDDAQSDEEDELFDEENDDRFWLSDNVKVAWMS